MAPSTEPAATGTAEDTGAVAAAARPGGPPWATVLLAAAVVAPMVVALAALRRPVWFPLFDLAMTELKVRDVGSANPPLVGLAGRIGPPEAGGSHPGPLAYWLMWPTYRLLGQTSWALQVASVLLQAAAVGVGLWIARRRGGAQLAAAVAAVLAVLVHAFGPVPFTTPWNPYVPVLWWVVLLLALWSVACGDLPMVPVAVLAGSICAQTHVPYLAMVVALGGAGLLGGAALAARRRAADGHRVATPGAVDVTPARWLAGSVLLGLVLWLPPLVDQAIREPGNIRTLAEHFAAPSSDPIGLRQGAVVVLERLDPVALLMGDVAVDGITTTASPVPGALFVAAWAASAAVAWRLRHRRLIALHGVLACAVAVAVVATSRIFGGVWNYLVLWVWSLGALMVLAAGWSIGAWALARVGPATAVSARRAVALVPVLAVALWASVGALGARHVEVGDEVRSAQVGDAAAQTVAALEGADRGGRYLVSWSDPTHLGSQGWGLLLELERRGLHVVGDGSMAAMLGRHRVAPRDEVDGILHLAVGPAVEAWRDDPSARMVAWVDHGPDLRAERDDLLRDVLAGLRARGFDDLAEQAERAPVAARRDARFPPDLAEDLRRVAELAYPVAVFLIEVPEPSGPAAPSA